MKKENVEKSLLGEVGLIEAKRGFEAEVERILQDFEKPDTALHFHCTGCGTVTEITKETAESDLGTENKTLPTIETGMYLKADGCPYCTAEMKNFSVEKISKV